MSTDKYERKTLKVDSELHRKIKILSAYQGQSIVALIAELVEDKMKELGIEAKKSDS